MTSTMPPPPTTPSPAPLPPPPSPRRRPLDRRSGIGTAFTVLAIGLAVVTLAYGVASIVNALAIRTYRSTTTYPMVGVLELHTGDAEVTLVADASDSITVEYRVRRGLADANPVATVEGDALVLDGRCTSMFNSFCSVEMTVHVPRRLDLTGRMDDGSLRADGLRGDVTLVMADGHLELTHQDAATVDVSAVDGRIDLGLVTSPDSVRVRTADGSASVCLPDEAPAYAVTEHRADGSIRVSVPDDPRSTRPMDLRTVDGSIRVDFCI